MLRWVVLFVLLTPVTVNAQKENWATATPETRAQQLTVWMKTELQLTVDQEPQVKSINLKYAQKAEILKANKDSNRTKLRELRSNDDAKDKELKHVLTPDQFEHYRSIKRSKQKAILKAMQEQHNQNQN